MRRIKRIINAVVFWIDPQRGAIDALLRKIRAHEDLEQTLRASRQSERNENGKLVVEVERLTRTVELIQRTADGQVSRLAEMVERLTAENSTLQSLVPHPGDGSCEWCGLGPATTVTLCEECRGPASEAVRPPLDLLQHATENPWPENEAKSLREYLPD